MEKNKLIHLNKRRTYYCPKCKEWFRLKMSLNTHDCKIKSKRKKRNG